MATKAMTKVQVCKHLETVFGMPRGMAADVLEVLNDLAAEQCTTKGVFSFPGLGKVRLSTRDARWARNPRTGEKVWVESKTGVRMRLGTTFKKKVLVQN